MMTWEENVRKVTPYTPGEQPKRKDIIKLNTNECPYPPAPGVVEVMKNFSCDNLRLYPDPSVTGLVNSLAQYYKVQENQVFVGVGSDDVLAMAFLTFFNSTKPILFPDITYSFYDVWADLFKIPFQLQPLDEDFKIRKEDYLMENGGVIIANPNAPTGQNESVEVLEEIIKANPDVVVIIDEAYVDFGGVSCLPLINKYENLLVVQTFSKSRSMAGMRIGFAMGSKKIIQYLQDAKYSFNSYTMNMPSIETGIEAVKDEGYFVSTVNKVIATRERVKKELRELGFSFADSKTNFIFAKHESVQAKEIFEALRENNIFVRYFNKARINNYLRISIGTDEEMDVLLKFLGEFLK
jgi:histidinol-phosphate aminotransferase